MTPPSDPVTTAATTPSASTTTDGASEKVTDFDRAATDAENVAVQKELKAYAIDLLGGEEVGDLGMAERDSGADLAKQIERVKAAASLPKVSITSQTTSSETSLTPDVVAERTASLYLAGVRRCYQDERKANPTAQGRVTLGFSVSEVGRSTSPRVSGFSKDMDACLQARASAWRFPVPKDSDENPTQAEYSLTLEFAP